MNVDRRFLTYCEQSGYVDHGHDYVSHDRSASGDFYWCMFCSRAVVPETNTLTRGIDAVVLYMITIEEMP